MFYKYLNIHLFQPWEKNNLQTMKNFKADFLLDDDVIFLNHGSFGACPRPVFEAYQEWQIATYEKIMDGYKRKLQEYEMEVEEAQ